MPSGDLFAAGQRPPESIQEVASDADPGVGDVDGGTPPDGLRDRRRFPHPSVRGDFLRSFS